VTNLPDPAQPVVLGVLNVTPDSFSDGGRHSDLDAAVAHGRLLREHGADLVDIGGESTRPGADRVLADEELRRVLPVIRELADAGVPMSIDTSRAAVAAAALDAGVEIVNDVSGGLADPDMGRVVADAGCRWILMHWRGHSSDMMRLAGYAYVVAEVRHELGRRVDAALAAGVAADRIVIDPGIGFAKTAEHNWALSAHLADLVATGYPVLFGSSRKSYLGALLADPADPAGRPRPPEERDAATVATTVLALCAGVWGVRVHDVRSTADAVAVWRATTAGRAPGAVRGTR
jgi:dihydropteroate synthase